MVAASPKFRWTVDEYEKMIQLGILTDKHKVELIRGEIVPKISKGDFHTYCVKALNRLFADRASQSSILSVQDPILLSDSEPEPDFALLELRPDKYRHGKPKASEILLLVEVADSSLRFDRDVKGPIYAENGIADYWIANLVEKCLEVYRDPQPDGTFSSTQIVRPGETVSLLKLPAVQIDVSELF